MSQADTRTGASDTQDNAMFSKITWRLLPLLFIAYGINYIDRINIGYAKLQMQQTLPWSEAVYGLGAGIFFFGYLAFEVPSNLLLERIGARKTLLRIMFCWGVVAAGMMFVQTPLQFYIMRFLLGGFEAGFFPGVLLYLTYWYPSARRGRIIAMFMVAIPVAAILAGPSSGAILKFLDGTNGWHGWQWLFLIQGLPASILGILIFVFLTDKPNQAAWLSDDEKKRLGALLDDGAGAEGHGSLLQTLRDPMLWAFSSVYFLTLGGNYAIGFILPTVVKSWGIPDLFMVGIYSAIPNVFGAIGMLAFGFSSDRFNERRWHFAGTMLASCVGLSIALLAQGNFILSLAGLCLAIFGVLPNASVLFAFITDRLPKKEAAAGIAAISCLGNLGPAVTPPLTGWIIATTGNPSSAFYLAVAFYLVAAVLLLVTVPATVSRIRGHATAAG